MLLGSDESENSTVNTNIFTDSKNNEFFKHNMMNRNFRKVAIEFINGETLPILVKDMMDDQHFKKLIHKYLAEHKLNEEYRRGMTEQDYCNLFLDCMSLKDFCDLVRENVTEDNFKKLAEKFSQERDVSATGVNEVATNVQTTNSEGVNAVNAIDENEIDYLEALADLRDEERDILALAEQATLTQEELDILALAEQASQSQSQGGEIQSVVEVGNVSGNMEVVPDSEGESEQENDESKKESAKNVNEKEAITAIHGETRDDVKTQQGEKRNREDGGEVNKMVDNMIVNKDAAAPLNTSNQLSDVSQNNVITVLSGQDALNHWQQANKNQTIDSSKSDRTTKKVDGDSQRQQSGSSRTGVIGSQSQTKYRSPPTGYGSQTEEESHDEAENTDTLMSDECSNRFDALGVSQLGDELETVDPLGAALEDLDLSLFDDALQNLDLSALGSNLKDLDMSSLDRTVDSYDISLRQDGQDNINTGWFISCFFYSTIKLIQSLRFLKKRQS